MTKLKNLNSKNYKKILLDKHFVSNFFRKNLSKFFPDFINLVSLEIFSKQLDLPILSEKFFAKYQLFLLDRKNRKIEKDIYIKSYSKGENIEIEYKVLKYLISKNFYVPRPFFYLPKINLMIYEGIKGVYLDQVLAKNSQTSLEEIIIKVAKTLAKLHQIEKKIAPDYKFSQTKTKAKGTALAFRRHYPKRLEKVRILLKEILKYRKVFSKKNKRSFTHGDFSLANIIIDQKGKKIGLIDFTESFLGDPLVDLGEFLAQLYSAQCRFNISSQKINKLCDLFKKQYLNSAKIDRNNINSRINIYQAWAEIYNASIFIKSCYKKDMKFAERMLRRAEKLIKQVNI